MASIANSTDATVGTGSAPVDVRTFVSAQGPRRQFVLQSLIDLNVEPASGLTDIILDYCPLQLRWDSTVRLRSCASDGPF